MDVGRLDEGVRGIVLDGPAHPRARVDTAVAQRQQVVAFLLVVHDDDVVPVAVLQHVHHHAGGHRCIPCAHPNTATGVHLVRVRVRVRVWVRVRVRVRDRVWFVRERTNDERRRWKGYLVEQ